MASPTQDTITLGIAVAGAVLGIVNTWRTYDRDRVKVRVVPVRLFSEAGEGVGISVTNLSSFPVTITSIGFTLSDKEERWVFLPPDVGGCRLPQLMEPRTMFTAMLRAGTLDDTHFSKVHRAFADTACGRRITGTSDALKQRLKHG